MKGEKTMLMTIDKKTQPSTNSSISEHKRNMQEAAQALRNAQKLIQQRRENNHRVISRPKS